MWYRHRVKLRLIVALSLLALAPSSIALAAANAAAAPKTVASRRVDFAGPGNGEWSARVTTETLGRDASRSFKQWRIEIERPQRLGGGIAYRTPGTDTLLDTLEKAHGANLWFPNQEAQLLGVGRFLPGERRQLVVRVYQSGADCGSVTVALLGLRGNAGSIGRLISIENACSLDVKIQRSPTGDGLLLSGPYYAENAALCCPTKAHAEARLLYRGGRWIERPRLFKIVRPPAQ